MKVFNFTSSKRKSAGSTSKATDKAREFINFLLALANRPRRSRHKWRRSSYAGRKYAELTRGVADEYRLPRGIVKPRKLLPHESIRAGR